MAIIAETVVESSSGRVDLKGFVGFFKSWSQWSKTGQQLVKLSSTIVYNVCREKSLKIFF